MNIYLNNYSSKIFIVLYIYHIIYMLNDRHERILNKRLFICKVIDMFKIKFFYLNRN